MEDIHLARKEIRHSVDHDHLPLTETSDTGEKLSEVQKLVKTLKGNLFLSPLLLFIPFGIMTGHAGPDVFSREVRFLTNFFSILPMAWLIGKSTEDVAHHTNSIVGGLINATFGNVVEMLLCMQGILHEEYMVTQLTLVGSILSNLLLVLGTAFLYGGIYHSSQEFNSTGAKTHCSLLTLSILGISLPTVYQEVLSTEGGADLLHISRIASIFMLVVYGQYLYFQLKTHSHLFEEEDDDDDNDDDEVLHFWSATGVLATCTVLTAFCTDYLIESIAGNLPFVVNKLFIAVILLPIIGNAAEHYTAIVVAGRNKMDLALGVAVGSSVQMALFVTPATVIFGWIVNKPMDLNFKSFQAIVLVLAVMMTSSILIDGQSTWLHGSLLVTAYFIISTIYFLESTPEQVLKAAESETLVQ
jgi:Ca2+:H+ antiporter